MPVERSNAERLKSYRNKLKKTILTLNLFPSIPPSTQQYDLDTELIATRVYIVSLVISLLILTTYTWQLVVTHVVTIQNPSYTNYSMLFVKYPQTLSCPCSTISIPYREFIRMDASFHQVCSSAFVTSSWVSYLN